MLRVFLVIDDYNELIHLQTLLKKLGFDVEGLQNPKKYPDVSLGFNPQILIVTSHGKKVDGLQLAQNIHKRRGMPKILALKNDNAYTAQDFENSGVDMVLETPATPIQLISAIANVGGVDENILLDKYAKIKNMFGMGATVGSGAFSGTAGGASTGADPVSGGVSGMGKADELEFFQFDENGQPIEEIKKVRSAINQIVKPSDRLDVGESTEQSSSAQAQMSSTQSPKAMSWAPHDSVRVERFEKLKNEIGVLPEKNFDREKIRDFNKKIRQRPPIEDADAIEEDRKLFVKALFKNK